MKETPLLFSIVIPMYNVENYIKRCINSVLSQTLSKSEFEVVLINDGSPDNSEKIARKTIENYENCIIINQENKGLGGARNTGIENAQGDYIIFLDSDDYLYKDALAILKSKINNADIIEFAYSIVDDNSELGSASFENKSFNNGYDYILNSKSVNSACNKTYKRSFLKKYNLKFKERIYGEDIEFNNRSFYFSKKTYSISNKIIAFYQSPDSITRNKTVYQKNKYLDDLIFIILNFYNFYQDHILEANKNQTKYLNYRLCSINLNSLLYFLKSKYDKEKVFNFINVLEKENAFYLNQKLQEREVFRRILKIKFLRTLLINLLCK